MYKRILVPTDGSPLSVKAVQSAVAQAVATGAELVALHVVPRYPLRFYDSDSSIPNPEAARTEKQWAEKGQAMVESVQKSAEAEGVKAKGIIMRSDLVAESVIAAAREHNCDLIVMASHGRKGLNRLLLGSETHHVLTHGTLPVLVVR